MNLPPTSGVVGVVGVASPPPRKRISHACQPCGVKKVKCDGRYPVCAPCRNKGVECSYRVSKRGSRSRLSHGARNLQSRPTVPQSPLAQSADNVSTPQTYNAGNLPDTESSKPRVTIDMISGPGSTQLLQTYFNCLHPLWPILYKPLYSSSDYANPTAMMAPPLVAAIFAIASCIGRPQQPTPNSVPQKFPEPVQFFEEALHLLQLKPDGTPHVANILSPSITTCQVLTILSLQQHGVAEYSLAATLCGLASAMAIELRIHRPCLSSDPIQREVQSRLWWNLYILEKMMSTEMGRPVLLRAEEADCPLPSTSEADEFELLRGGGAGVKVRSISGVCSAVRLCVVVERISREVYGVEARKRIREDQVEGEARRINLWTALQEWEQMMDSSPLKLDLSPDLASVPAAVTNYVIMHHTTILLHRPFIARWSSNPASSSTNTPSPLSICLASASSIITILEKYFDRLLGLPCDMIFSVFTAASMLLYQSNHGGEGNGDGDGDREGNQRGLRLCVHWLSVLGRSWKSAGKRRELLGNMFNLPHHPSTSTLSQKHQQWTPVPKHSSEAVAPTVTEIPIDWTFLRDFGDPTDEFYALDVQFRGLLDAGEGFKLGSMSGIEGNGEGPA